MSKLNEEDFIKMANKIYINPNDDVLKFLKKEYNEIDQSLENLKKINIDNVVPLTRIAKPINFLREDIEDKQIILDKKIALSNAAEKDDNFVIMKRIFK